MNVLDLEKIILITSYLVSEYIRATAIAITLVDSGILGWNDLLYASNDGARIDEKGP